jgi:formamidopyrimidine-DNA glycosylase
MKKRGIKMPELPEVECIVRDLRGMVVGQTIRKVEEIDETNILNFDKGLIEGYVIKSIGRNGKNILFNLEKNDEKHQMLSHLIMTGAWFYEDNVPKDYQGKEHIRFVLSERNLMYCDVRKFGRMYLDKELDLGPEPFDDKKFDLFVERLTKKKFLERTIKDVLLEQWVIAGIGNIYASEILFEASIRPKRKVNALSADEHQSIWKKTAEVFRKSIDLGGSSISNYRHASGKQGSFQKHFKVYQQAECKVCGGDITKEKINGRTAYWCNHCQK